MRTFALFQPAFALSFYVFAFAVSANEPYELSSHRAAFNGTNRRLRITGA